MAQKKSVLILEHKSRRKTLHICVDLQHAQFKQALIQVSCLIFIGCDRLGTGNLELKRS